MDGMAAVYLAGPRAWTHETCGRVWSKLDCLASSLVLLARFMPPMPVIVFHEDLLGEDMLRLEKYLGREIRFEPVDFKTDAELCVNHHRYGERVDSTGYRMMCRFFCGVMQNHPALSWFDRYMRLDDDSYLLAPVPDAAIERMFSFDYTFAGCCDDPRPDIENAAEEHLSAAGFPPSTAHPCCVPYNNYHTASLRLWKDPVVESFMAKAREKCLTDCWNDAPVHRELIARFCPALGYHAIREHTVSYRHNQHCCHPGDHNELCSDGTGGEFHWGHPDVL